jgi:hypothetical protein
MPSNWTIGTSGGNKLVTQPTIGTSGGDKDATQAWVGTSGGNKLTFPDFTFVSSGPYVDEATAPATASVTISFRDTGDIYLTTANSGSGSLGSWVTPAGAAPGDYELFATLNSGTLFSGTTGSWLALTSDRDYTVERPTNGFTSANLTFQIRTISSLVVWSDTLRLTGTRSL